MKEGRKHSFTIPLLLNAILVQDILFCGPLFYSVDDNNRFKKKEPGGSPAQWMSEYRFIIGYLMTL
jgi:hypothetical protein